MRRRLHGGESEDIGIEHDMDTANLMLHMAACKSLLNYKKNKELSGKVEVEYEICGMLGDEKGSSSILSQEEVDHLLKAIED